MQVDSLNMEYKKYLFAAAVMCSYFMNTNSVFSMDSTSKNYTNKKQKETKPRKPESSTQPQHNRNQLIKQFNSDFYEDETFKRAIYELSKNIKVDSSKKRRRRQ